MARRLREASSTRRHVVEEIAGVDRRIRAVDPDSRLDDEPKVTTADSLLQR